MNIRLNYPADIDLLILRMRLGSRFPSFIKKCLHSAIDGTEFWYDPPSCDEKLLKRISKSCIVHLSLDEKKDASVISFFKDFPPNGKSEVVRKMINACATSFPLQPYLLLAGKQEQAQNSANKKTVKLSKPVPHADDNRAEQCEKEDAKQHTGFMQEKKTDDHENEQQKLSAHAVNTKSAENEQETQHAIVASEPNGNADTDKEHAVIDEDDMMSILSGIVNHK